MPQTKSKKSKKKLLVPKGAPHPGYPSYKLDSAHLTDSEADKAEHKLLSNPKSGVDATRRIRVPSQHLVYAHKAPRITPKRPRLRR